jgi:chromosome segregation ATPase
MKQRLLEELEALREAHRTAKTQADFDALGTRLQSIEALSASAAERSKSEKQSLRQLKAAVAEAVRASREGQKPPANFSGTVFALMQAVRRGTTGFDV